MEKNIEVKFDLSNEVQEKWESGLISFQEVKQHLTVTIKMNEDYSKFSRIMEILEN